MMTVPSSGLGEETLNLEPFDTAQGRLLNFEPL